ncbi:MAG TPA: hypothetical protein VGM64_09145 [Lacunisphaera sp.]
MESNLTQRRFSPGVLWLGLGVVLLATGAKLILIQWYGTDQPYADQWAAEGMYFLRGPLYYKINLVQLTSLHGEHRPALTRLWVRGLILANEGQWDCYVELVADLLIYAAYLIVIWRWLVALVKGPWLIPAAVCAAVLFGLPCAYENYLWGFQSGFLFLLLMGTLHVWGTVGETRLGLRWGLAQVAGFLGIFSIAAGAMSAAALALVAGLELVRGRRNSWAWSTLVVNVMLFGLGFWLVPNVTPDGTLWARLFAAIKGTGYLLSWPFAGPAWCLLLQAPWVILFFNGWWKRDEVHGRGDRLTGAMGLWVLTMAFAIAYGRALTSDNIGVRYYDVLVLGLFINVPALVRICVRTTSWWRFLWRGLASIWLIAIAAGLWHDNRPEDLGNMFKFQHDLAIEQQGVVRDFMVSNDPANLQEFEKKSQRFPHFQTTLDFLRDPKVPVLLPPSLTPDHHQNRLSRLARQIASDWPAVIVLGLLAGLAGAICLISRVRLNSS